MSYTNDFITYSDVPTQNRIQMSLVKAAVNIASEAVGPDQKIYLKRNALANQVLNSPQRFLAPFALAAIEAAALTTGSTDAAIDNAIASVWNGMAGVTQLD